MATGAVTRAWIGWAALWLGVLAISGVVGAVAGTTTTERLLRFAAAALILTAILHSFLGERFILQPLFRRNDLPSLFGDRDFVPDTLRFVWHLFSIAFLGFAALLIALATETSAVMVPRIISGTAAVCAVVTAVVSRGRHLSWVAFAATAVAVYLAY